MSALEKVGQGGRWRLGVLHNSVNLSDGKVNSLGELILIINLEPLVQILDGLWLYVFANVQILQLFLLQNNVVLRCLWWLSKLCPIRSLLSVLSKCVLCKLHVKLDRPNRFNFRLGSDNSWVFFEPFGSLDVQDGFDNSQTLKQLLV